MSNFIGRNSGMALTDGPHCIHADQKEGEEAASYKLPPPSHKLLCAEEAQFNATKGRRGFPIPPDYSSRG